MLENKYEAGGLGLPNIAVKADPLLVKHMCRILSMPDDESYRMLGYWRGNNLSQTGWEEDFTELGEIGPVSRMMSKKFPLHLHMSDTFMESLGRE